MKKQYLLFILLVGVNLNLIGQNVFSKRMHLGFPSVVLSSVETNDSCFYVTGLVADSMPPFKSGLLFMKYDWSGELLFAKTMLSSIKSYEAWENTLTPLADGNFILSAFSSYNIGLLLKINPQGDTIFMKAYESPYIIENPWFVMKDLKVMSDGGFVLAAIIEKSLANNYDNNILVIRTDSLGTVLWQKVYGGSTDEIVHALIATNDGGLLIGAGKSNVGLYMIKTDGDGEEEWEYTYPNQGEHGAAFDLFETVDNGLIISTNEIITNTQGIDLPSAVVLKLNSIQEEEWKTTFKDKKQTTTAAFRKILPLPDNQHFLAAGSGYLELADGWLTVGKLIKCSYEGDSIWTRYYHHLENQDAENLLYDLEATPDGGFIMCSQAKGSENPTWEDPNQQGWLLKVDEHGCLVPGCHLVSSTIDVQKTPFQIKLFPNPVSAASSDLLNVYFYHPDLQGEAVFQLTDVSGKVLLSFSSNLGDVTHMVPVSNLASGLYWLTCRVGDIVLTEAVVVE